LLKYIIRRLLILPVIIFLVTLMLFALILQLPVEQRVWVYVPAVNPHLEPEEFEELINEIIERRGLNEPLPVQYVNWMKELVSGRWVTRHPGASLSWTAS
jgi:peptide/nickel transport system permease protein